MFRKSTGTMPDASRWLEFPLREITGSWVSADGAPAVRIFRTGRKNSGHHLEITFNNPRAVFSRPVRNWFGVRYFDLFGRVGLAYDAENDVLLLSAYGQYRRAKEPTTK